jgi:hypothetical protein
MHAFTILHGDFVQIVAVFLRSSETFDTEFEGSEGFWDYYFDFWIHDILCLRGAVDVSSEDES